VTHNDKEIVLALRTALAERIGQQRFDLWFGEAVQFRLADGTLRVNVPDPFTLDRVRSRFLPDLRAVCEAVCPRPVEVEFQVVPVAEAEPTPATEPAVIRLPRSSSAPVRRAASSSVRAAALDDFVVGESNRLAFTGVRQVLQRLGQMTPLFIYGPTGTGKTHLLQGLAAAVRQRLGMRRVVALSSEQFTSQFLEALQGSGLPNFRRKYRDVEVLLIDDLQFFSGKRATIVELQYTIDSLLRESRQLVLTADRAPIELNGLGGELVGRLSGGLVCGMEQPDEETRGQILRQLAQRTGRRFPDNVLRLVAAQIVGDARHLAGALNRLHAVSEAMGRPVTVELAETALADIFRLARRAVRLPDIEHAVCDVFGIDAKSLQSDRKGKTVSQPRMLAMWLARKYTRAAFSEIGEYFGRRSHSTVISAQKKVADWMADGATLQLAHGQCDVADAIRRVEARLRTG
jgi:chromosomal replication initiator protein